MADNISITLKAGTDYYLSVKSTNASKGGNAAYFVFLPSEDVFNTAALSMPEASAGLDGWPASSAAADSAQDSLLAGLTDPDTGDAISSATLSASARLQLENGGTLQQQSGFLA